MRARLPSRILSIVHAMKVTVALRRRRRMKPMIAAVAFALTLGATTSPSVAQEDGLSGGKIILIDQGKGKKKGQTGTTSTTGTSTSGTSTTASKCGNGVIDAGEQCDGNNLGGVGPL